MEDGIAVERRLSALEASSKDHARLFTEYQNHQLKVETRVERMEGQMQAAAIESARREEREKQYLEDIASIRKDLATFKGSFTKILWAVGLAVVGAMVKWVLTGNLAF